MALIQAALAGLIALIIAPGWLFYFDITPKAAVLLAGVAVLLGGAVFRPPQQNLWVDSGSGSLPKL
jgi:hypothetical protein